MKIGKKVILFLIFLLMTGVFSITISASPNKAFTRHTISVAIPNYEGLDEVLMNQFITGYTHEYLLKIAQIASIDFQFIHYDTRNNQELLEILEKVKDGEIDMMGGISKGSELDADYIFSNRWYGETSTAVVALSENDEINERQFILSKAIRVGLSKNAVVQNTSFLEYCKINEFQPEIIYYDSFSDVKTAMNKKEIDVMLGKDTSINAGMKTISYFNPLPYYFITGKENQEVMDLMNEAMFELHNIDPYFEAGLYRKYYYHNVQTKLTQDEIEFVESLPILKVGVMPDLRPLQYYDVKNRQFRGILIDLMNEISIETGLKIDYILVDNMEEIKSSLEKNIIDIVLGIPTNYEVAKENGFLITSGIASFPIARVHGKYSSELDKPSLISEYLNIEGNYSIIKSDNEIFNLISNDEALDGYVDGYRAKYLMGYYNNIEISPSIHSNYEVSLGVNLHEDIRIMRILEHGIKKIDSQMLDDIIYKNIVVEGELTFIDYVRKNPILVFTVIFVPLLLMIGVLTIFLYNSNRMKKTLAMERQRYAYLARYDQLTGVYNQQTFKKMVQVSLNAHHGGTLISVDLDNFKDINDTYGHLEGDRVLVACGNLLNFYFKDQILGRMGGDEFMIYMEDEKNSDKIKDLIQNLKDNLHLQFPNYEVTFSVGATIFDESSNFENIYHHVDLLLYEIKFNGRNGIKIGHYNKENQGYTQQMKFDLEDFNTNRKK